MDEFCEPADRDPARTERGRTSRIRVAVLTYFIAKADGEAGMLPSMLSSASS